MAKRHTLKGKQAFLEYYQTLFNKEVEFQQFLTSLTEKYLPVLLVNKTRINEVKDLWDQAQLSWKPLPWFSQAIQWPEEIAFGTTLPGYSQDWIYPLSASSLLPVIALELKKNDLVLDACAAPGGKSLAISSFLESANQLVSNDLSFKRSVRMQSVFNNFSFHPTISIGPAERLYKQNHKLFDKILVDAPCSSEKHVFNSPKHLNQWSPKRITKLQQRQIKMVQSMIPLLKPGGRLVYSTCAVTPEENEKVIEHILHMENSPLKIIQFHTPAAVNSSQGMETEFAPLVTRIWSHKQKQDPMFIAVLEKHGSTI